MMAPVITLVVLIHLALITTHLQLKMTDHVVSYVNGVGQKSITIGMEVILVQIILGVLVIMMKILFHLTK